MPEAHATTLTFDCWQDDDAVGSWPDAAGASRCIAAIIGVTEDGRRKNYYKTCACPRELWNQFLIRSNHQIVLFGSSLV